MKTEKEHTAAFVSAAKILDQVAIKLDEKLDQIRQVVKIKKGVKVDHTPIANKHKRN